MRQRNIGFVSGIKKSAKEAGNALMQQRLKSWQPVMSPKYVIYHDIYCSFCRWVMGTFGGFGLVFVVIGIILLVVCSNTFNLHHIFIVFGRGY